MTAETDGSGAARASSGDVVLPCRVLPAAFVTGYANGGLASTQAWSVEAHLPGCPACRTVLASCLDGGLLARNRAVLLARICLPEPGPAGLLLRRCGVPDHVTGLLSATPSLRRSWLAGVALVLLAVIGAARIATLRWSGAGAAPSGWLPILPFLLIGPLLPLGAVAAAFSAALDPARELAVAAPVSKAWLLCVRATAVIAASLIPTMIAALVLPGPWWLAVAILLPALAVCAAALAAATILPPLAAAVGAGACWVGLVLGVNAIATRPLVVLSPAGQTCAVAVLAVATALLVSRRRHIDVHWMG